MGNLVKILTTIVGYAEAHPEEIQAAVSLIERLAALHDKHAPKP